MKNEIVRTIGVLIPMANKVNNGLNQLAGELNLHYSVTEDLPAKVAALITLDNGHKAASSNLRAKVAAVEVARKQAAVFMRTVREHLKPILGPRYSEVWNEVGFMGNLEVATKAEGLQRGLQSAKAYLTTHPIADGGPVLTPARATAVYDTLTGALDAVSSARSAVRLALEARDAAVRTLEGSVRTVLHELHGVLDPMDARWLEFGFQRPGQKRTPDRPEKVSVLLIGQNAATIKWLAAPRAEYYRVYKKVDGLDEDYIHVGSPADLDFALENLPAGRLVEVAIAAVNNGGESQRSVPVQFTTLA